MPRDADTGVYSLPSNSASPAVPYTPIASADFNAVMEDIGDALSTLPAPLLTTLMEAMAATLPTSLPATAGKLWNNGGVICIS